MINPVWRNAYFSDAFVLYLKVLFSVPKYVEKYLFSFSYPLIFVLFSSASFFGTAL